MASTSTYKARSLTEAEIVELLTTIESEDEHLDSIDSDSDCDESEVVENIQSVSRESDSDEEVHRPKRVRHDDPLFKWQAGIFNPIIHKFDSSNSGILLDNITDDPSVLDIFEQFFTYELLTTIAAETNRYYLFVVNKYPPTPSSRLTKWTDTSPEEMFVFFAITLLMPRNKKLKISEYWSTDPFLSTPIFSDCMSRDRYLLLLRLLHFSDNVNQPQGDRLYKLRCVIGSMKTKFSDTFYPFENLCIDESLLLFKGRLSFLQYIPSKRSRFGIKVFILCDCETGFVLDFIVYTGKDTDIVTERDLGVSGAVVRTMMTDYLHKGHTLWLDNWYSSPLLFDWLHKHKTNACGTVRKTRKHMPKFTKKLSKGEVESQHTDNMIAIKWVDRRDVCMLSTLHTDEMKRTEKRDRQTGEQITKPHCVVAYNSNMGAVDKTDMMLVSVECIRKTVKWYKKLFFHLLDIAVLNSQCVYNVKTGRNMTLADYELALVKQIIHKYHTARTGRKTGRPASGDQPLRLIERHFPTVNPPTEKKENPLRNCHVCSNTTLEPKKRKQTRYMCNKCNIGLCIHPCFEKYHTLLKF